MTQNRTAPNSCKWVLGSWSLNSVSAEASPTLPEGPGCTVFKPASLESGSRTAPCLWDRRGRRPRPCLAECIFKNNFKNKEGVLSEFVDDRKLSGISTKASDSELP